MRTLFFWLVMLDIEYLIIEEDYPDRVINPGAAEQLMIGMGAGLAMEGKIPVCYSILLLFSIVLLSSSVTICTMNRFLLNW